MSQGAGGLPLLRIQGALLDRELCSAPSDAGWRLRLWPTPSNELLLRVYPLETF